MVKDYIYYTYEKFFSSPINFSQFILIQLLFIESKKTLIRVG